MTSPPPASSASGSTTTRRTAIVLNAGSGGEPSESDRQTLRALFEEAGHETTIDVVRGAEELESALARALAAQVQIVVAGGGDGTVNAVAQRIVDANLILGVLPLGTLNHFAKDLGLPSGLVDAARVILDGHTRRVDIGEVNGSIFLNNSSLGLYPRIVQLRARYRAAGWRKWIVAVWATVRVVRSGRATRMTMQVDGAVAARRTPLLFIGNNAYRMEGFDAGIRDSLDGGSLALYVVRVHGQWPLLRLVWRILTGRAHSTHDLEMLSAREATISLAATGPTPTIAVAIDGEVRTLSAPLRYLIRVKALTVCAPRVPARRGSPA